MVPIGESGAGLQTPRLFSVCAEYCSIPTLNGEAHKPEAAVDFASRYKSTSAEGPKAKGPEKARATTCLLV